MRKFLLLLCSLSLVGCALFSSQNRTSDWAVLDKAVSVSCDPWPLRELDLGLDEFIVLKGDDKIGFLVDMKRRNGSRVFYYHEFIGDTDISADETHKLIFGSNGIPLNQHFAGSSQEIAIVRNKSENSSALEVHDLKTNVVKYVSSNLSSKISSGSIVNTSEGHWLVLEGSSYRISFVNHKKSGGSSDSKRLGSKELPVRTFPKAKFSTMPTLLPSADSKVVHLLSLKSSVKSDGTTSDVFNMTKLETTGRQGNSEKLDLPTQAGVETWAAQRMPGGVKLAYVEGDSLIGQANLRLAKIKTGGGVSTVEWNKEILLENIHVSEPLWVSSPAGQSLLMLKWVDGESTLAAYKVGTNGVESSKNFGVFSKGSAVIDAFSYGEDNEVYAILRRKDGYRWNFDICKIGEID